MSFLFFLVGFLEKWTKSEKSGQLRGSLEMEKRPIAAVKDPLAAARPRGKVGPVLGSPRRSYCSQHNKMLCFVLFCYAVAPRTRLLD